MRIHILDDTEFILDILAKLLKDHQVRVFSNPETFINSISAEVDVIITDLRVARYDAINNIRKFKSANIAVKVIVISAYFTEETLLKLIECHIFQAVKKTHEYEWFQEVVDAVNK